MIILFDLATPKVGRFFPPIMSALAERGVSVAAVSRDHPELQRVLEWAGIEAPVFGSHGGADLRAKVIHSLDRTRKLVDHFADLRPNAVVCLNVADSARAAYALAIPLVCFCDIPEARHTASLSMPLAARVLAPDVFEPRSILRYGVAPERLQQYASLDPVAWLEREEIDPDVPRRLGLDPERPLVVCRETEWQSSYVREDLVTEAAERLRAAHPDWQVFEVPRYADHPFVHIPSLLAAADLLVGGGGTMCIEAAWLGVPVLATRALPSRYMDWLFEQDLAVPCGDARALGRRAEALVAERGTPAAEARRARARRVFDPRPFPLDEVVDGILKAVAS